MLYDQNIHIKNANEVLRAILDCFNCIIEKNERMINSNNYDNDSDNNDNCIEPPVNSNENPSDIWNIFTDTFTLKSDDQTI